MSFFRNFWKVRNRKNSEFSVNSKCSEIPVSKLFPNILTQKQGFVTQKQGFVTQRQGLVTQKQGSLTQKQGFLTQKQGFFDPKTGNYFQTIFTKFLRVQKDQIFPKNFRTLKTKLF
jgi:hypothetical protein